MFYGGYFLRFTGTIFIYLYKLLSSLILGKKVRSFKNVWSNSDELLQKMIGFAFIMVSLFLLFHGSGQW